MSISLPHWTNSKGAGDRPADCGSLGFEDDRVVARTTFTGTHEGAFEGIEPTGEEVAGPAISIARVEDGAIADLWVVQDQLGILQQLGAVEPPGA